MSRLSFLFFLPFFLPHFCIADDNPSARRDGVVIVALGLNKPINEMAVYPEGGIPGRPLLVSAHGNGSSGPNEIKSWLSLAQRYRFTIVCPTFLSSVKVMQIPNDRPYFNACLRWIAANIQYDHANAYMTGFSGGGFPVWYLGVSRSDFFRGLCLQSGNFAGSDSFEVNLAPWHDKPVHLVWGAKDTPTVLAQNRQALDFARKQDVTDISFEIIQGAGHQPHRELVIKWMEQEATHNPTSSE